MKKWLSVLITFVFLLLLVFQFSDVQWQNILPLLKKINPLLFLIGMGGMVLSSYLQGIRWVTLLYPQGKFSYSGAFASVYIGHWFNLILPVRAGEIARPYHFSRINNLPLAKVIATTVLERIMDIVAISLLVFVSLITYSMQLNGIAAIVLLVYAFLVLLLLFFANRQDLLLLIIQKIPIARNHFNYTIYVNDFFNTLYTFKSNQQTPWSILQTITIWVVNVFSYWVLLQCTGLSGSFKNISASIATTIASIVGHSVPSLASGLGVLNYAVVVSLQEHAQIEGISYLPYTNAILTASIVIYLAAILPDLIIGGYFYLRDRNLLFGLFTP